LLLFDSQGCSWISKHSTGIPSDGGDRRHIIYPGSFIALSY
jgi:hypothetical protein